jgi:hypothetical protein
MRWHETTRPQGKKWERAKWERAKWERAEWDGQG